MLCKNYVFLFGILRKGCFATAILVRSFLLKNSSLGVLLIVVYGKSDTTTKILQIYDLNLVSLAMFFISCFKVRTSFSASPLEAGWYGGTKCDVCIGFLFKKISNSWDTYWDPLSETISTGNQFEEKRYLKALRVLSQVVIITSIHFEDACTTVKTCAA